MTEKLAQKISALQEKLLQMKAQAAAAEARRKTKESAIARAVDTRKKILIGSFMLQKLGEDSVKKMKVQDASFDAWLARPSDREVFGFTAAQNAPNEGEK